MIASISGNVLKIEANSLVVALGGMGVRVLVPKT
ncbi:MAG: hypothetical protein KC413_02335, partial [Anaerolineales bacterium]|nr:hypothetical protein [Anaerolineales bacterium]